VTQPRDADLPSEIPTDPRGSDPTKRLTAKATARGTGRNTESFDPGSTLVRPDLRILVQSGSSTTLQCELKHDDVVIVPELFGREDDWSLYYKMVEEMTASKEKGAEWISWHEGAHLITKRPEGSETYQKVLDRLCEYFRIEKKSIGTRFNWYRDSSDWKPFHHDSAAFNPQRAKNQNITVGASFGATRELAFIRAEAFESGDKCRLYFPQVNNGVFSFGRDANILWKHGINALPPEEQDGKGRISIILWGLAKGVIEEEGSPPLLGSDGIGPHASQGQQRYGNGRSNGKKPHMSPMTNGGGNDKEKTEDDKPMGNGKEASSDDDQKIDKTNTTETEHNKESDDKKESVAQDAKA